MLIRNTAIGQIYFDTHLQNRNCLPYWNFFHVLMVFFEMVRYSLMALSVQVCSVEFYVYLKIKLLLIIFILIKS